MVCHSLLQWTTFCQTSPPWPDHLGWPHTAWLSFTELDKTIVLWSDWLVFCDYGFSLSALWCPLPVPTILLGFLFGKVKAGRMIGRSSFKLFFYTNTFYIVIMIFNLTKDFSFSSYPDQPRQTPPKKQWSQYCSKRCYNLYVTRGLAESFHLWNDVSLKDVQGTPNTQRNKRMRSQCFIILVRFSERHSFIDIRQEGGIQIKNLLVPSTSELSQWFCLENVFSHGKSWYQDFLSFVGSMTLPLKHSHHAGKVTRVKFHLSQR